MTKKNKYGFALIELMVIVTILGILSAYVLPKYKNSITKAKEKQCLATRINVEKAAQLYIFEHEDAASPPDFQTLLSENYIDKYPVCTAGGSYIWVSTTPLKLGCSIHGGVPLILPETDAPPLFTSNFDDTAGFITLDGKWKVKDGILSNQRRNSQIFIEDGNWEDCSIAVNAKLEKGNGYGIYYRASIDSNEKIDSYIFQYDPGLGNKFVVRKINDSRETGPIASIAMPSDFPVYDQYHQIEIKVQDDSHEIYVNGEKVLDFNDSTFTSGTSGFRTWDSTKASFEEIEINQL
ncbi:MAG: family 16 glycoside hydrolase [Elusimicrobiota bacterium]|nr:family 16 glycoside hydrolase [Elusimicrobiota bacterium]